MLAASRAITYCRAVMPYAQWAVLAIQIGYSGYRLYLNYREQFEADARAGRTRSFEETMELVSNNNTHRARRNIENQPPDSQLRIQQQEDDVPIDSSSQSYQNLYPRLDDDSDVLIVHDSNQCGTEANCESHRSLSTTSTSPSQIGVVRDMYNECFICATPLDDSAKPVATLPFCMHPFHKSCLDGILKWHQRCPVCDVGIFSPI